MKAKTATGLTCICGNSTIVKDVVQIGDLSVNQLSCPNCGIIMRSPSTDKGGKWLERHWRTIHRNSKAAEHDINAMLRAHVDELHCDQCARGAYREACRYYGKDMCPDAEWRGPCKENEGEPHDHHA